MKTYLAISIIFFSLIISIKSEDLTISSPDERLKVIISIERGIATYSATYDNKEILLSSRLGLKSNIGDFTQGLTLTKIELKKETNSYNMTRTKASHSDYVAKRIDLTLQNSEKHQIIVSFLVSNNDIAFRYTLLRQENDDPKSAVITS